MKATIDWKRSAALNELPLFTSTQRLNQHALDLMLKRGNYSVCIVDEETGDVLYPSIPAHSAPEVLRAFNGDAA